MAVSVTLLVGRVIVWVAPALTVGAVSVVAAALTVMCTVEVAVAPLASVAVSSKTYVPWTRLPAVVLSAAALAKVAVEGPLTWVHFVDLIVPPVSDAVPVSVTLLVGRVIVWAGPALSTGCIVVVVFTFTVYFVLSLIQPLSVTRS